MFGRKKKQAQFNTMDDSRVTVYDFKRRIQCPIVPQITDFIQDSVRKR